MKYFLVLMLIGSLLLSCNEKKPQSLNSLSGSAGCSGESVASSATGPLFKLDGEVVTRAELPRKTAEQVYQNEFEAYSKNQNIFKEYALRVYLAKKKGKLEDKQNPPDLVELLDIPEPSEKEMKALFNQHKARMPKDVTFDKMKTQIAGYLKSQQIGKVFKAEVEKMEKSGAYQSMIAGPIAMEMNLDLTGQPSMGNKSSKVQVVEVSDYTCGHCQRAHPEVKAMLKKFGNKINFTQVNFALRPNGLSGTYVLGAYCAQKQSVDKFWAYHNAAFDETSKPHDHSAPGHSHAPKSAAENKKTVLEVAKKVKLDEKKMSACLDSKEAKDFMNNTINKLSEQGINGTPVFLVNNKKIMGGVAEVEKAINELL